MKKFKKIILAFILLLCINTSVTYAHDDFPDPIKIKGIENIHITKYAK